MSSITALATIDTRHLRELLYGAPATHDDLITLATIAQEAGTDLADLADATGEPGHDPRTGVINPRAHETAETDVEDELLADEEPDEADLWADGPLPGEDLEDTVTRRQAAADIAAELEADLIEAATRTPDRAADLAARLRGRGLVPAPRTELAEVAA